jgi:hypothetical protein
MLRRVRIGCYTKTANTHEILSVGVVIQLKQTLCEEGSQASWKGNAKTRAIMRMDTTKEMLMMP